MATFPERNNDSQRPTFPMTDAIATALLTHAGAAVMIEDSRRRILCANGKFRLLFKIAEPPEELIGLDSVEVFRRASVMFNDPARFIARIKELMAGCDESIRDELELADGRIFEREFSPACLSGTERIYLWQYRDLTPLRDAERSANSAREAAAAAEKAKAVFLANMSHELRTPMTAIIGYADLLARAKQAETDRREWARQIGQSGQYLLTLLNDILDFTKIESGQLPRQLEPCPVSSVLGAVASVLRPRALEKGLACEVVARGPLPRQITTDAIRLRRVLLSLVDNAVKFTSHGGVKLVARLDCGPSIVFEVHDTGAGIPEHLQASIFESFETQPIENQRAAGVGLGLAIAKQLTRLLGGTIEVQSRPGAGSVFTVRLPVSEQEATDTHLIDALDAPLSVPAPAARAQAPNLGEFRILVVDDNADNRQILETLLVETTAYVMLAENGQQALDTVLEARNKKKDVDLILLDMQMPVMDGYTAARKMREAGIRAPIIAVTAYALAGDDSQCLAAGCDDYLPKPIAPGKFYETIGRWLGQIPPECADALATDLSSSPMMVELAAEFRAALPELAKNLREAFDAGDATKTRTLAHRLRGTAANLGLPEVSYAATEAENAIVKSPDSLDTHRAVSILISTIELVVRKKR